MDFPTCQNRRCRIACLAVIVGIAFAVRLAAGYWWESRLSPGVRFGWPDSAGYWSLAQGLARGESYGGEESRIFRTPGFPALLAGLFRVLGDDDPHTLWARGLGAFLGAVVVVEVYWLAGRLFDERTALVAAGLTAMHPEVIASSVFLLSEMPFCPLMLAHLMCWGAAGRASSVRGVMGWAGLGGMFAAAATLMRPSWLLFTPFALLVAVGYEALRRSPRHWRTHSLIAVAMLAGLVATMSPWWARNYRVTGKFVATTLQVGASLYDGLNPAATGASDMRFVPAMQEERRRLDQAVDPSRLESTFEFRLDRHHRDAAVTWARQHPGRVLELAGIKLWRIWNVWPNAAEMRSWTLGLVILAAYLPVLVLAAWGAWRFARQDWPYALCLLPACYFTLLHMIFVGSIRYRQPAMLMLIVLAAGAATCRVSRRAET